MNVEKEHAQHHKKSVLDFVSMKSGGEKMAWVTSYSYWQGYAAEKAGIDAILVGDSGGMIELGYSNTNPVAMDEMIGMAKAVRRGAPNTFLIGDLCSGTYELSGSEAVRNSLRFIKEANCDAVKLEGASPRILESVRAMVDSGIVVFGHLGLTPQSAAGFGGYKVQGNDYDNLGIITDKAIALQGSGASFILLEAMPAQSAAYVRNSVKIPVYGIGAGPDLDGQLLIIADLLGFCPSFKPKFAKNYVNSLVCGSDCDNMDGFISLAHRAISQYIFEVKNGSFPDAEHTYKLTDKRLQDYFHGLGNFTF